MPENVRAYFHRYGSIRYKEFATKEEAMDFIKEEADLGELFGDCIVDSNNVIIHDFDAETEVFGRKTPKSRVGEKYKKEG